MVPQMEHVLPPKIDSRKQIGHLMSVIGGATSRCDNSNPSLNVNKTKRSAQSSLRSASMATQRRQWGAPGPLGCTTDDLRCSTDTTPSCHKGHTNVWQMKSTHAPLPVLTAFYMETLGSIISVASVHPGTVVLSTQLSRGHLGLLHSGQWFCSI